MKDNYITVEVSPGSNRLTIDERVYQWDYGLKLRLIGINTDMLPSAHFAYDCQTTQATCVSCSMEDGAIIVPVPKNMLSQRRNVFCYLYYEDVDYGRTELVISIPVIARAKPDPIEYTEEETSQFNTLQALLNGKIAQVNDLIDQVGDISEELNKKYEKPQDGIPESDLAEGIIPTELKNPNKLIINDVEYDGSEQVEVTIEQTVDQEVIEQSENAVSGGAVYTELKDIKDSIGDINDSVNDILDLNQTLMQTVAAFETLGDTNDLLIDNISIAQGRLSISGSVSVDDKYYIYINGEKVVHATMLIDKESCGCISIQPIAGCTMMLICPPALDEFSTATVSCCHLKVDMPITSIELVACGNSVINSGAKVIVEGVVV